MDPVIIDLLRDAHDGSWLAYGSRSSRIITQKGGRQGCQSGACVFNTVYSVGLILLRIAMQASGITFRVKRSQSVFWCGAPSGPEEELVDMTFVDDECIVLVAASARSLVSAIHVLLELLDLPLVVPILQIT